MIVSQSYYPSMIQQIAPGRIFVDSAYVVYADKILLQTHFEHLGEGRFASKQISAKFEAPGWIYGYGDDDAARTPRMVRTH